ncbi:M28 family metallopeptidase [Acidicapsa dinghuensis]|uniref:M28 family metallopeptidase n=1 Tax=Acidicapsa dinghuensis TaxID=2218256 RepID=A0ABW1EMU5_9BACT|nr:M28 family metallopeptidase [Acidicapsa dinghuensis]
MFAFRPFRFMALQTWFWAIAFALSNAALTSGQTPPSVFGYNDFTAQAKIDAEFLPVPDASLAGQELKFLTAQPHLASTPEDHETALYVARKFRAAGLETEIVPYKVLMNQPRKVSIEAHSDDGGLLVIGPSWEHVSDDAFQDDSRIVMPFAGSSGSGDVTGEVVYANYGRLEDFDKLARDGVDLHGKVVLVRYGANFRGVKVYLAEQRGAIGVLIYSDPQDDGYFQGDPYPNGPWRPDTGVQRGSVQYLFKYPGDPETPGVASTLDLPDSARLDPLKTGNQPSIIAIPISSHDAAPILRALKGPTVPKGWQGALPFSYHTGGSGAFTGVTVHLVSDQDYELRIIWDVIGKVRGSQFPQDWVIVGNHRDAWVYGAADPCSGTAAMLEAVHGIGSLLKQGWRPKRTILFASWDAEEEGLIGSTEWVEQHGHALDHAVAYFNTDVAVTGSEFGAEAVPSLKQFLREVAQQVPSPQGGSVYMHWKLDSGSENRESNSLRGSKSGIDNLGEAPVGDLGSGSDYTPFFQHAGVPSTDIGSRGSYGVYHSVFDDYTWFIQNADPTFEYLQEIARVLGLEALHMADADVLPYDYVAYARAINASLDAARHKAAARSIDFSAAQSAGARFMRAAEAARMLQTNLQGKSQAELMRFNTILRQTENQFLSQAGLPNRPWYKHLIYAPGEYSGYAAAVIPGVNEALDARNTDLAAQQLALLTQALNRAAGMLEQAR